MVGSYNVSFLYFVHIIHVQPFKKNCQLTWQAETETILKIYFLLENM